MPYTPFHLGPALLFGVLLRRRLDFGTFLVANVVVDVHAMFVVFGLLPGQVHGVVQTYLGGLVLAAILTTGVLVVARRFPAAAHQLSSRSTSARAVALASVSGTALHVTLDSIVVAGSQLFYPIPGNPLYGLLPPLTLKRLCMLAFFIGVGAGLPTLWKRWQASIT